MGLFLYLSKYGICNKGRNPFTHHMFIQGKAVLKGTEIFVFVANLLNGSSISLCVLWHISWVSAVSNHPAEPHKEIPVDETVVRSPQ